MRKWFRFDFMTEETCRYSYSNNSIRIVNVHRAFLKLPLLHIYVVMERVKLTPVIRLSFISL